LGDIYPDLPNPYKNEYHWMVEGQNSAPGVLELRVADLSQGDRLAVKGIALDDTLFSATLHKSTHDRQIIWDGVVQSVNPEKFGRALQSSRLLSNKFKFRLISFTELEGDTSAPEITEGEATWLAARDLEARRWLKRNGVQLIGRKGTGITTFWSFPTTKALERAQAR
jgi:hypothetical protein